MQTDHFHFYLVSVILNSFIDFKFFCNGMHVWKNLNLANLRMSLIYYCDRVREKMFNSRHIFIGCGVLV